MFPLKPKSVEEFLHYLHEYNNIETKRTERIYKQSDKSQINRKIGDNIRENGLEANRKEKDKPPPLKNDKGEPKCYNCAKYGHIAKDCDEPKRTLVCFKCKGEGHTARH